MVSTRAVKWLAILGLFMALWCGNVVVVGAGEFAGSFVELGVGARALGMGGAFSTVGGDGTVVYWNPALLGLLERPQVAFMHAFLFQNLANHDFINVSVPLQGGATIGLSWIRLGVDDIPRFSELEGGREGTSRRLGDPILQGDGVPDGFFSDTENAYIFTFSRRYRFNIGFGWQYASLPVEFPVGVNFKLIRQSLDDGSSNGIGLDLGTMLRFNLGELIGVPRIGRFAMAMSVRDITNTIIKWNTKQEDVIARNFKLGFGFQQSLGRDNTLIVAYDKDTRPRVQRYGIEYWIHDKVALRLGHAGRFTVGAGVRFWKAMLDYAFVNHDLGGTHRISGAIRF